MSSVVFSSCEIKYFTSLPSEKKSTVTICFQTLLQNLELDSEDSKSTLKQILKNYRAWDTTEVGQVAWSPLLDSLQEYLNGTYSPTTNLIDRIKRLQSILAQTSNSWIKHKICDVSAIVRCFAAVENIVQEISELLIARCRCRHRGNEEMIALKH